MTYEHLSIIHPDETAVAVVTLERPDVSNALNNRLRSELADAAGRLMADETVGAVVVTGGERCFSAGADIREEGTAYDRGDFEWYVSEYARANEWYRLLSRFPKAIVAALSGATAGSGLQLALCADVIIGSPTLQVWLPQVGLGLTPHIATVSKLARMVGQQRAVRLALTGERANADDALEWGLISEVVATDQLVPRAVEIADAIARHPALAVQMTKRALIGLTHQDADTLALLDEVKSFGMVHSSAWSEKRADLLKGLAERRRTAKGHAP